MGSERWTSARGPAPPQHCLALPCLALPSRLPLTSHRPLDLLQCERITGTADGQDVVAAIVLDGGSPPARPAALPRTRAQQSRRPMQGPERQYQQRWLSVQSPQAFACLGQALPSP
jgi:hypothetical protein